MPESCDSVMLTSLWNALLLLLAIDCANELGL